MKKHTETVVAWASQHCSATPQDIIAMKPGVAAKLSYTDGGASIAKHFAECGYTRVGTAEITFMPLDHDTMVANKVDALRAEKKKVQAESQLRVTELEGQIQNLLAITYQPAAE